MPLPAALQETLDNLAFFTERQERIDMLIGIGEEYTNYSDAEVPRTEESKVPGCESEVFVAADSAQKRLKIAVDNPQGISAMAMAVILQKGLAGASNDEINAVSENIVYDIFGRELSMGKSMGLTNLVRLSKQLLTR